MIFYLCVCGLRSLSIGTRIRESQISPILSSPFGAILHPPSISWCLIRQGGSAPNGNKGSDNFLFLPYLFSKSCLVPATCPFPPMGLVVSCFYFSPIINNHSYYVFSLFVRKCVPRERLSKQLFFFSCQCYFALYESLLCIFVFAWLVLENLAFFFLAWVAFFFFLSFLSYWMVKT